jgi:hypothetical protein
MRSLHSVLPPGLHLVRSVAGAIIDALLFG